MTSRKNDVICLYEQSGLSAADWAINGYDVYCYDILHEEKRIVPTGKGNMIFMPWDAKSHEQNADIFTRHKNKTAILLAFPPCTDLAVTGAAWFADKKRKNPQYRQEAMDLVYTAVNLAEILNCPFVIENPISVISSEWRKPDFIFDPYQYGGYLPEDDIHPFYPEYINPRDAYPKRTCYWTGNGFKMPIAKPVPVKSGYSKQHRKLGGKGQKTKLIRSCSPRGIAKAIYIANVVQDEEAK
jgi:hypothetical protein